jgi:hypothetical protein
MERGARAALKKAEQEDKRRARELLASEKKARAAMAKASKQNSARIQKSRQRFKALATKKAKAARGTQQQRQQNRQAAANRRSANRARGKNLNQQIGKAKRQTQLGPAGLNRSQQAELRRQGVPEPFVEQHARKRDTQVMPDKDREQAGDKETTEAMKKLAEEVKKLTEEMTKQRQKAPGGSSQPSTAEAGNAVGQQAGQAAAGPRVTIRRANRPTPQRPEQPNPRGGALSAVRQTQLRSL